jgi:surfactin synthase thioesterase subunit
MNGSDMSAEHHDRPALVCVPFAGAGASFFHPWRALSADRWRLLPVELPGRERRLMDEPFSTVVETAEDLVDGVAAAVGADGRCVLFGHSLGAVLAYELVHLLTARGVRVDRLVVSGSSGPWTQRTVRATGLPDDEFLARIEEFSGFKHEALEHPEMRELILPVLRADCEMHEDYRPSTDVPVTVPISAVRGSSDGLVSADQARQWRAATIGEFTYTEFPGDHMYLVDQARPVLDMIETATVGDALTRHQVASEP